MPILPHLQLPQQNPAGSGTMKSKSTKCSPKPDGLPCTSCSSSSTSSWIGAHQHFMGLLSRFRHYQPRKSLRFLQFQWPLSDLDGDLDRVRDLIVRVDREKRDRCQIISQMIDDCDGKASFSGSDSNSNNTSLNLNFVGPWGYTSLSS